VVTGHGRSTAVSVRHRRRFYFADIRYPFHKTDHHRGESADEDKCQAKMDQSLIVRGCPAQRTNFRRESVSEPLFQTAIHV
jgi:hypothetical protein